MPQLCRFYLLCFLLLTALVLASCRSAAPVLPADRTLNASATERGVEAQLGDRELLRADCFSEIEESDRDVVVLYVDDERRGVIPIDAINDVIGVDADDIETITVIRCDRHFDDTPLQGIIKIELREPGRAQSGHQGSKSLLTEQPTVKQVQDYEAGFGSDLIPGRPGFEVFISPDLCPPAASHSLAQPLRYERPATNLPPLSAEYFFAVSDSVVQCVIYGWGETTMDMITRLQRREDDNEEALARYDEAFTSIVTVLTTQLGQPQKTDATPTQKRDVDEVYFRREVLWEAGDLVIEMFMIVGNTTRRIRATQYWKP